MSEPAHLDVSTRLTIEDVVRASNFDVLLELKPADRIRLDTVRSQVIAGLTESEARVYGFNTGFGDNRNRPTIPKELRGVIQDNLILSHAAGYGDPIEAEVVRAALAIRSRTLAIGHSGVRSNLLSALCSLYNSGLVPVVPRFGSVGASGDLAPLSHLALPLLGRGRVFENGVEKEVDRGLLKANGVEKLTYRPSDEFPGVDGPESNFAPKEGLALNNGTSFMAAWLALAVAEFENVLWHADLAVALNIEAMSGVIDAYLPEVQALRPHAGIQFCSQRVLRFLEGSNLVFRKGEASDFATKVRTAPGSGVVDSTQDDYCLRSASVVHGSAWKVLRDAKEIVEIEINSVTDNPIVIDGRVLSGSHFHGMPLALAADQLRSAMAIVGGISERRVAKLMNDKRNYGLPRHLVIGDDSGVKSGWMIGQYLCASMANELKTRSMPYCVGNVTTGNESEDFVSMGANACRAAYECIGVLNGIVAVELASAIRAILIRVGRVENQEVDDVGLSIAGQSVVKAFCQRGIEVGHSDDRPLEPIFAKVSELVRSGKLALDL